MEKEEGGLILRIVAALLLSVVITLAIGFAFLMVDHFLFPHGYYYGHQWATMELGRAIGLQLGPHGEAGLFQGTLHWLKWCAVLFFMICLVLGPNRSTTMIGHFFARENPGEPLITIGLWVLIAALYFVSHAQAVGLH